MKRPKICLICSTRRCISSRLHVLRKREARSFLFSLLCEDNKIQAFQNYIYREMVVDIDRRKLGRIRQLSTTLLIVYHYIVVYYEIISNLVIRRQYGVMTSIVYDT